MVWAEVQVRHIRAVHLRQRLARCARCVSAAPRRALHALLPVEKMRRGAAGTEVAQYRVGAAASGVPPARRALDASTRLLALQTRMRAPLGAALQA